MKSLGVTLSVLFVLLFGLACNSKPSAQATPSPSASPTLEISVSVQVTPTAPSQALYVCVAIANVRSGPGTNYAVLKQLTQGTSITPQQKSGEWYYLGQDSAQKDSYIHQSVVCEQSNASTTSGCPSGCAEAPSGCGIKGNISGKTSEKTYYLPGDKDYEQIIVDPDYGERWFCTESEAQANGWHRAAQ